MKKFKVSEIDKKLTYDFIDNMHYAQRRPSISFSYGLYEKGDLVAILTIGKPASNPLCVGVCGKEYSSMVYELNRLCAKRKLKENALSFFVSSVLRDLKKEKLIVISFADEGAGHKGYIYQSTNWIYTGKTKERTDKYMPGNKHPRHYTNEFEHLRKVRTSKHRYIYFCCDKKTKKELLGKLNYKIQKYPKGDNTNYILGERVKTKVINKEDKTFFFE